MENKFLKIHNSILILKELNSTEKLVLSYIIEHSSLTTGKCFVNKETIAEKLGICAKSAYLSVNFLNKNNFINIEKTLNKKCIALTKNIIEMLKLKHVIVEYEPVLQNDTKITNLVYVYKHKTRRIPSERLKVKVLMRDGNKCKLCGIILTGDNIHFDHIKPWSKEGETTLENLQILCAKHNMAKGNYDNSMNEILVNITEVKPILTNELLNKAIDYLNKGGTLEMVKNKYQISKTDEEHILSKIIVKS